jgi:hypothetical protein
MLSSRIDLRTANPLFQLVRDSAFTSLRRLSFYPSVGVFFEQLRLHAGAVDRFVFLSPVSGRLSDAGI